MNASEASKLPLISVVVCAYNHAPYLRAALESILSQTIENLELVVVDDGSTDDTQGVLKQIRDPRVVVIHQSNGGPSRATNRGIAQAQGRYIALMPGDDVSCRDRLERQLSRYLQGPPRILFGLVDFIDERGDQLNARNFLTDRFCESTNETAQTLRRLFFEGNHFAAVTPFAERAVWNQLGPFDPFLYQLQDYDMWIRAAKRFPLEVMPEVLVHYRIRAGERNLSAPRPAATIRTTLESSIIARRFFDDMPEPLFRAAFAAQLKRPDLSGPIACACEQALLLLEHPLPLYQLRGVERLHELSQSAESAAMLEHDFALSPAALARRIGEHDLIRQFLDETSIAWERVDEQGTVVMARERVARVEGLFHYEFTFTSPPLSAIWRPAEHSRCLVRLHEILVRGPDGASRADPSQLNTTGVRDGAGVVTLKPAQWIKIPVDAQSQAVVLRGEYVSDAEAELRNLQTRERQLMEQQRFQSQVAELQKAYENVVNSRSWKTTAPMRRIASWMRRAS